MTNNAVINQTLTHPVEPGALSRLDAIDFAKGLLILAVVLSHAWFANSNILGDYFPYSMPAFFLLAGYVYKPGRTYLQNMKKRVIQLILPYIFFSIFCCLLYPAYAKLVFMPFDMNAWKAAWIACVKGDALNMLMSTPMWFLTSLFTASIFFFAIVDKVRESTLKTAITVVIMVALTVLIVWLKKDHFWPWHIGYALFACAVMLIGAHMGYKKWVSDFNWKILILGIVLLAISLVLNHFFPGSGKTSVEVYIENGKLYGVLTCFILSVCGSIGLLCLCTLFAKIPVLKQIFCWLGKNTIWILCIHYSAIMLIELWLFNHKVLSNSLTQIIGQQLFGWGYIVDKPKDIVVKVLVALVSIGISAIYVLIHKLVKNAIKSRKVDKKA